MGRARRIAYWGVGALLLAIGAWLWSSGSLSAWSDTEHLRALVKDSGAFGPLVFIAVSMALFPVFLMGPPVWSAVLLWPWPLAWLYSYIAAVLASLATFALSRSRPGGGRPIPEKLQRYSAGLLARPIATVIVMRLLLWANPVVDLLIALSGTSVRAYLIGTFVGMVPITAAHVLLGAGIQHAGEVRRDTWLALASLAAGGVAGMWWWRRRSRSRGRPASQ